MKPLKSPAVQSVAMQLEMLMVDLFNQTYLLETNLCGGFILVVVMSQANLVLKQQVVGLRRE